MAPEPGADPRYAAHLALSQIGSEGQARIRGARVLLLGLGGLGCAAAPYLCGSGVGQLTLCDFDRVECSNLARQTLFSASDVGRHKCDVAEERLRALNPQVDLRPLARRFDPVCAEGLVAEHDMVIDASDNYGTRLAVNRASLAAGKPWVMGACVRLEGQLALFSGAAGPCYRCVYGAAPETLEDCPGAGIFAPVAGMIGVAMAHLALTRLAGMARPSTLHLFDGADMNWRSLVIARRPDCPECGDQALSRPDGVTRS